MTPPDSKPPRPPERAETARQRIMEALRGEPCTPKDVSRSAGVSERVVAEQLEHIRKSLRSRDERLEVTPARCRACGFEFTKRDKLSAPSRCPLCKASRIAPPLFQIVPG